MLTTSKYYHVYNRTNGNENLFREEKNYRFFLEKYAGYINPIATTYCWALMQNHFHFLIKIKSEKELLAINFLKPRLKIENSPPSNLAKVSQGKSQANFHEISEADELSHLLSKQFSKLFSSYAQAFNKVYKRKGSLFSPNFKHKEITSEQYRKQVVLYIHNNAVHHGICKNTTDYEHTSYHQFIDEKKLSNEQIEVVSWFDDIENFKQCHTNHAEYKLQEDLE